MDSYEAWYENIVANYKNLDVEDSRSSLFKQKGHRECRSSVVRAVKVTIGC